MTDLAVRYLSKAQVAELERPVVDRATRLVTALWDEFLKDDYAVDIIVKHVEADHAGLLVIGSRDLTKSERF